MVAKILKLNKICVGFQAKYWKHDTIWSHEKREKNGEGHLIRGTVEIIIEGINTDIGMITGRDLCRHDGARKVGPIE